MGRKTDNSRRLRALLRRGNHCYWCAQQVMVGENVGDRMATVDHIYSRFNKHLTPEQIASLRTMSVLACYRCNAMRCRYEHKIAVGKYFPVPMKLLRSNEENFIRLWKGELSQAGKPLAPHPYNAGHPIQKPQRKNQAKPADSNFSRRDRFNKLVADAINRDPASPAPTEALKPPRPKLRSGFDSSSHKKSSGHPLTVEPNFIDLWINQVD